MRRDGAVRSRRDMMERLEFRGDSAGGIMILGYFATKRFDTMVSDCRLYERMSLRRFDGSATLHASPKTVHRLRADATPNRRTPSRRQPMRRLPLRSHGIRQQPRRRFGMHLHRRRLPRRRIRILGERRVGRGGRVRELRAVGSVGGVPLGGEVWASDGWGFKGVTVAGMSAGAYSAHAQSVSG